jgi:hypothetical protein
MMKSFVHSRCMLVLCFGMLFLALLLVGCGTGQIAGPMAATQLGAGADVSEPSPIANSNPSPGSGSGPGPHLGPHPSPNPNPAAPHRVDLSWLASTSSGVASYNVYRAITSGGPYTKMGNVPGNSFTDSKVTAGTTYFYVVTAVNVSNAESVYSGEASSTVPTP